MTTLHVTLPFAPRAWQRPLMSDRAQYIVAVVHRRAGKSTALMWRGLRKASVPTRGPDKPTRVVHVLPLAVQWGRTGLWDQLERAAKSFPGAEVIKSERRVVLPGGGIYQAGGMDNPDSWRGGYADELIEDECDDVLSDGLQMVIEPMLADCGGTRLYAGTPKGNGRLADLYDRAGSTPGWSRYRLTYQDTGVIGEIDRATSPDAWAAAVERLRLQLTPEEFAQEMEVSFETPNSGSYYGKLMDAAERDGRVRPVPWEPKLPVLTSWDLGIDDAMALWFLQLLPGSGEVRAIDYIEDSGQGLDHYARELACRGYVYGGHHLPHDAQVRELGTGRSRKETLESLGVRPIMVGRALPVIDGINAVRTLLPRMWFDAAKTELGRKRLRGYRRQWIEDRGVWSAQPYHDSNSHGADALREFAVNFREPLSPAQLDRHARARRAEGGGYDPMRW